MMRLLFVINTMGLAGAEKALLELLRALPAQRVQLDLLALLPMGELFGQLPPNVRVLNRHPRAESVLGKGAHRRIRRAVLLAALRRGNAVRLAPYLLGNYRAMRRAGRVQPDKLCWRLLSDGAPCLQTTYDLAVAYLEGGATYYVADHVKARKKACFVHIDYPSAGYGARLDRGCYDAFCRIYVVSDEVGKRFASVYPEQADKIRLFHNLLDEAGIRRRAEEGEGFADGYAGKRIVSVGRLHPQKAYPVSIEAMRRLADKNVDARWYVLGEGDERPALERLIAQEGLAGRFVLMGAKQNPYPYMKQADLYLHATRFEGKSVAIEEAQALRKPIIASDCTGNREQIQNGVNGLLVPLDAEAIAEAILSLLQDPALAARLGAAGGAQRDERERDVEALLTLCKEEAG